MPQGIAIGGPMAGKTIVNATNLWYSPDDADVRYVFVSRYWLQYEVRKGVPGFDVALDILEAVYLNHMENQVGISHDTIG